MTVHRGKRREIIALLGAHRIGREVEIDVLRAGRTLRLTVTPREATAALRRQNGRN